MSTKVGRMLKTTESSSELMLLEPRSMIRSTARQKQSRRAWKRYACIDSNHNIKIKLKNLISYFVLKRHTFAGLAAQVPAQRELVQVGKQSLVQCACRELVYQDPQLASKIVDKTR
jgi:hypothetical protein